MILIADSGSTKTDWRFIEPSGVITQHITSGLNPYHLSEIQIAQEISKLSSAIACTEVQNVFFYGAGCSVKTKIENVKNAIKSIFVNAEIEVEHDLLAAARATCLNQAGMVAILGTGANSCQFNGKEITENVPSLGYLLGDEGSGAYMGRILLTQYLQNELPQELTKAFQKQYPENLERILDNIYKQAMPSRYLASFAPFLLHHKNHHHIRQLVAEAFQLFFTRYICKYSQHKTLPLHFVGSIAFYHNDTLQYVAEKNSITLGKIIEKPIAGLVLYHTNK
jgi:N-acetylglucosamine kinase-like BadF-type ATPase